jgi:protein NRD1
VTRQWLEQARKAGQALGPSASDGTYAAGVNHVTELLPALMQDIISVAPEDQKVRFFINKIISVILDCIMAHYQKCCQNLYKPFFPRILVF